MATLAQGSSLTLEISEDQTLLVTAGATGAGSVSRLGDSAGEQSQGVVAIAASSSTYFGGYGRRARFLLFCSADSLTYSVQFANPLLDVALNSGAAVKTKVIPITAAPTGSEQDTGWDLPARALLLDVLVNVTTAEVTGTTKTLDVGLLASESGGDADGFIDGVSVAAVGLFRGAGAVAASIFNGNTRGVLMSDYVAGTNADDRGLFREKPHLSTVVTAKSVSYTAGANNFAEFRGSIIFIYVEVA